MDSFPLLRCLWLLPRVANLQRPSFVLAIVLSIVFLKEKVTWQIAVGGSVMIAGPVLITLVSVIVESVRSVVIRTLKLLVLCGFLLALSIQVFNYSNDLSIKT
ncbi:MAG TPA: hypothetical protein VKB19_18015 [Pedobacter sp.]|nr:hypothetical protein [Pedobacter sp.]